MFNKDFKVVTTFHKAGYENYAWRFLESFAERMKGFQLHVYAEGIDLQSPVDNIVIHDFDKLCGKKQTAFEKMAEPYEKKIQTTQGNHFLWQASRFAHKYYACEHAIKTSEEQYVIWMDADTIVCKDVPDDLFTKFTAPDKYWSRVNRGRKYPECGFMIWNKHHSAHERYWQLMEWMYDQGACFQMKEWHDSYLWWMAEHYITEETGQNYWIDLGDGSGGHAFVRGPLGEYFDHCKGKRKTTGFSPERKWV